MGFSFSRPGRRAFFQGALAAGGLAVLGPRKAFAAIDADAALQGSNDLTDLVNSLVQAGGGQALVLGPRRYVIRPETEVGSLIIEAPQGRAVIGSAGGPGHYLLASNGSSRPLPRLAENVCQGSRSLRFVAAHGLRPGDWIRIFDPRPSSYSAVRSEYRQGFNAVVSETFDNKIVLVEPVPCSLDRRAGRALHIEPTSPTLRNLSLQSGSLSAARFTNTKYLGLHDIAVEASAPHGIYVERSLDFVITGTNIRNAGSRSGSDYGLAIGNSEKGRVLDCDLWARRHGISVGGGGASDAIPNRSVEIKACAIGNERDALVHAADMHGNCERTSFANCVVTGGVSIAGKDNSISGCSISSMRNGVCVVGTEVLGGSLKIVDCILRSSADASQGYRGIIDFGGNSIAIGRHTVAPLSILIAGLEVEATGQSTSSRVIELRNRGSAVPVDLTVRGLHVEMDAVGTLVSLRNHQSNSWNGSIVISGITGDKPHTRTSGH
ncbi:hypothetical protein SAMN06297468_1308 [Altererythrobacter xiamenensis]|uniref:Gp49 pectin lyase-like domain-containing protein n=1 Tax=Altererythrobacter xiamenensis TaxID=1316679 RepID=A0A1Y6F674_9SPHN|nr:hypothetical protein [Altererythrobacter xiamenensis]SMQ69061.1 hypothetical protein SAMN06297468_1308 [Altererythrobacter xiamenensis]